MKSVIRMIVLGSVAGFLAVGSTWAAQNDSSSSSSSNRSSAPMGCHCGRMGVMARHHQKIVAHPEHLIAKLKQMQTNLDKKVDEMNAAKGNDKVQAMSDVIDELVKQREHMLDHLETMMARRGARTAS